MVKKIAVVVWSIDPEGKVRFLLRHNRPFDGYPDEWTYVFGSVEDGETSLYAAEREAYEELGVSGDLKDINYRIEYTEDGYDVNIEFYSLKLSSIDERVILSGESIGYDWMVFEQASKNIKHDDERVALKLAFGFSR